jgi:formamidopyrimidine-DNA glycosylase
MPELPEVETTLRGIQPHIEQQKITCVTVRQHQLRWPIPNNIQEILVNQTITSASRRGKYLLLQTPTGTVILHLGMSGRLHIVTPNTPPNKHDHVDVEFANAKSLRLTDPRRFGAFLWTADDPLQHALLKDLGPEPLSSDFTDDYLWTQASNKKVAVKSFIMDSKIVVGVGNIYANEALFAADIHPEKPAGKISAAAYTKLTQEIKKILQYAIQQGGTTLKDFLNSDGKPGYFKLHLKVYGRGGLACFTCQKKLTEIRLGQRSTVYCARCQRK